MIITIEQTSIPEIIILCNIDRVEFWKTFNPYLETLLNNVMQILDVHVYMEAIDNGFILYCKQYRDFHQLYSFYPLQLQKKDGPSADTVRWRFEILENRSGKEEQELLKDLQKFYRKVNMAIEPDATRPHSYIMQFHSIPHFFESVESIIHMLQEIDKSEIPRKTTPEKKMIKEPLVKI